MIDARALLNQANRKLQSGDPAGCRNLCSQVLLEQPGELPALHLRGVACASMGDTRNAINDLAAVWTRQPGNLQAALGLGSLLRQAEQYDEALEPLRAACAQVQLETGARYELARCLTRLRRPDEAIAEYRLILKREPGHADASANLAMLLERANQLDEAGQWADCSLTMAPGNLIAGLTRATLDRRSGQIEEAISRLQSLLDRELSPMNKSIVLNQLGQCHDLSGEWEKAFENFKQSNEVLRAQHPHGKPLHEGSYGIHTIDRLRSWLAANPPASWSENSCDGLNEPVFLVGFPRSGTTLMDQALSAHPDIEVLEENELLDPVRKLWVDRDGLRALPQMNPAEIRDARQRYFLERERQCSLTGKTVIVDKLPLNLVYLFLISRLFPRARILFMLRDPRDACLSCFFQTFDLQGAMPYFLDLNDTSAYYDQVMSLGTETMNTIGNPLFTQRYEDLVLDFEPSVRKVISYLGLEWNPRVLDYRRMSRNRSISTPSYQQVVQPLYHRSIGRWKNYWPHIEPGCGKLGQWVNYFNYPSG